MKKAAYDVEVQTKKAEAELAYELQAAKTKQRIKDEQMQIKVVERTQEILVQVCPTSFQICNEKHKDIDLLKKTFRIFARIYINMGISFL